MTHHTINPEQRAADIADHESKLLELERCHRGEFPYRDWPSYWLKINKQVRLELMEPLFS